MSIFQVNSKEFPFLSPGMVSSENKKKFDVGFKEIVKYVMTTTYNNLFKISTDLEMISQFHDEHEYVSGRNLCQGPLGYVFYIDDKVVRKISISDMSEVSSVSADDADNVMAAVWDGGDYVYLGGTDGGEEDKKNVIKINIDTMTVEESTGLGGTWTDVYDLAYHDGFLYVADYAYDKVLKMDPSDLTIVGEYTASERVARVTVGDDGYLYAADTDGKLYKIDPSDMSEISSNTPSTGGRGYSDLKVSGGYVYAGVDMDMKLFKIDTSSLSVVDSLTFDERLSCLEIQDGVIYVGVEDNIHSVGEDSFSLIETLNDSDLSTITSIVVSA